MRGRWLGAAAVSVVLLAACSDPAPPDGDAAPAASTAPSDEPEALPPGTRDEPATPGAEADRCSERDRGEIGAAVTGQLAAFADGDFETALTFASEGFREQFDPASFAEVIRDSYPVVADNVEHTLGVCVRAGAGANVIVDVTATGGRQQTLLYLLDREAGAWRISGATAVVAEPTPASSEDDAISA